MLTLRYEPLAGYTEYAQLAPNKFLPKPWFYAQVRRCITTLALLVALASGSWRLVTSTASLTASCSANKTPRQRNRKTTQDEISNPKCCSCKIFLTSRQIYVIQREFMAKVSQPAEAFFSSVRGEYRKPRFSPRSVPCIILIFLVARKISVAKAWKRFSSLYYRRDMSHDHKRRTRSPSSHSFNKWSHQQFKLALC